MTEAQARTLLAGLLHEDIDASKLTSLARSEIIAAFELILVMTKLEDHQDSP